MSDCPYFENAWTNLHNFDITACTVIVKPSANVMVMGKFRPRGLQSPWMDFDETWNIWLCGEYDHTCKSTWCCDNVGCLGEYVTCHMFRFLSILFFLLYRQHCAQRKAPVGQLKLLRGRFWGFSPRRGDTLHWWGWNLARSVPCNVSPLGGEKPQNRPMSYLKFGEIWHGEVDLRFIPPCKFRPL